MKNRSHILFVVCFLFNGRALPEHRERVPEPPGNVTRPEVQPGVQGHATHSNRPYDIYQDNCHTEANLFLVHSTPEQLLRRGILSCKGDPVNTAAGHTVNWEVREDGRTCLYNWGHPCCWPATHNPPRLEGSANYCAWEACGEQHGAGTRFLPAGQMVEIPGVTACVRTANGIASNVPRVGAVEENPLRLRQCLQCCSDREEMWRSGLNRETEQYRVAFTQGCRTLCHTAFGPIQGQPSVTESLREDAQRGR